MASETLSETTTSYRVVAEANGRGWQVHIADVTWPARFLAADLEDADTKARKLIWAYTGSDPGGVELAVAVPSFVEDRLDVIETTCADLDKELCAARRELRELGLSAPDVAQVLAARYRPPSPDGGCW